MSSNTVTDPRDKSERQLQTYNIRNKADVYHVVSGISGKQQSGKKIWEPPEIYGMLVHVFCGTVGNTHLKRSALFIFVVLVFGVLADCFARNNTQCHFLQNNQQGQQKSGQLIFFMNWLFQTS